MHIVSDRPSYNTCSCGSGPFNHSFLWESAGGCWPQQRARTGSANSHHNNLQSIISLQVCQISLLIIICLLMITYLLIISCELISCINYTLNQTPFTKSSFFFFLLPDRPIRSATLNQQDSCWDPASGLVKNGETRSEGLLSDWTVCHPAYCCFNNEPQVKQKISNRIGIICPSFGLKAGSQQTRLSGRCTRQVIQLSGDSIQTCSRLADRFSTQPAVMQPSDWFVRPRRCRRCRNKSTVSACARAPKTRLNV